MTTESVWDYPRPPRVEKDDRRVVVKLGEVVIADTTGAVRVLETSHPPVFYLPLRDVAAEQLARTERRTFCEFKGVAHYWDVAGVPNVAWGYDDPSPGFEELVDRITFYPGSFDCFVGDDVVTSQEGDFYGGWITPEITGPFKGGPGTLGW